jgi:RHS repeat-associated protein
VYVDALVLRDRDATGGGTLSERLWVQQDANWNVTALVNGSGSVVERYVYDPYGNVTVMSPSWAALSGSAYAWIYGHQGGRLDATTGLYGFRNRDLSPVLARWIEVDPLRFKAGDVDLYRDVGNNPIEYTDPSGEILPFLLPVLYYAGYGLVIGVSFAVGYYGANTVYNLCTPPGPAGAVYVTHYPWGIIVPHRVIATVNPDGSVHTYSFSGDWFYDDELDQWWVGPYWLTCFGVRQPDLTANDIKRVYLPRKAQDDSKGFAISGVTCGNDPFDGAFNRNCWTQGNVLISDAYRGYVPNPPVPPNLLADLPTYQAFSGIRPDPNQLGFDPNAW